MKLLIPESGHQRRQQDLPSMCRGCRRAGPTSGAQRFAQRWCSGRRITTVHLTSAKAGKG